MEKFGCIDSIAVLIVAVVVAVVVVVVVVGDVAGTFHESHSNTEERAQ